MKLTKNLAVAALACTVGIAAAGCEKSREEMRPDMDKIMSGERGPQSRDLREMASRLAPDVLQARDIAASPYRAIVVMKHMDNKTEDMPGRNLDIYLAKLTGLLNSAAASDRILFKEEAATLANLQAQELGGRPRDPFEEAGRTNVPPPTPTELQPQFALYGTVYSMNNGRTSYYLFQFKLTNLLTGGVSWSGQYEVRTLN
jgi:hypothetical protein